MGKNSQGWVKIHRRLLDSDLWGLEPFTKGQAWIDLILLANYRDGKISVRGNVLTIKRGQVGWSEVKLAERWGWSRNKVRRYLKWLETEQQVIQQKNNINSIITILKYEEYQSTEQQTEQQTIQQKDSRRYTNKNVKKEKKVKKDTSVSEYGNSDVNRFISGIEKEFGYKLPKDNRSRFVVTNILKLLTRNNNKGEPKKDRGFLKDDLWDNVNDWAGEYHKRYVLEGYGAKSWYKLSDHIKLWLANEGKYPR